jgi:hypothetical protein
VTLGVLREAWFLGRSGVSKFLLSVVSPRSHRWARLVAVLGIVNLRVSPSLQSEFGQGICKASDLGFSPFSCRLG